MESIVFRSSIMSYYALGIIILLGIISVPTVFASTSDIASLNSMQTPTPTPTPTPTVIPHNPPLSPSNPLPPFSLSNPMEFTEVEDIPLEDTKPTIQTVNPNNLANPQ